MKIDVCPGDDLQTFYPSEADSRWIERVGRSKLIHSNLTELAYVQTSPISFVARGKGTASLFRVQQRRRLPAGKTDPDVELMNYEKFDVWPGH